MSLGLGGIAEAFADRNFRWYSLGSIISWLSFFVQAVAVSWTAWDLTHSTAWLAIVALADATANIVLMPIGGVLADRQDRLRMLLIAYACATIQAAILAGLAFSGALTIYALTALAAFHGAAHAFSIPASYGLLPQFIGAPADSGRGRQSRLLRGGVVGKTCIRSARGVRGALPLSPSFHKLKGSLWLASPSKIASIRSTTDLIWF